MNKVSIIRNLIVDMQEKCVELGIPGYLDNLTINEILELSLHYYMIYIESNVEKIKEDMFGEI